MNSRRDFLKMGAAAAIAMKTKRRLYWDPVKEHFKNDDEANCMLSRPHRAPYMMDV